MININYTGRQVNITPEIRKYCERRIKSIGKLVSSPADVDVILSVEKYRYEAEINISAKGFTLNATGETQDILSSLALAFDNLERQVKKEKDKMKRRKRGKKKKTGDFSNETEGRKSAPRIIRDEDYILKPMSVNEAALTIGSKKKDVFVFRDIETQRWGVLYKRKDGNLGLIELD